MTIQTIYLGQAANDGSGEPLREGGQKINANFAELDTRVSAAQTKADAAQPKETGKGLSTNDFTTPEKTKLAGVATGATANSSDATLVNRANHTGTQLASTISNFAAAALSVALTGLSVATGTAVIATDSILVGIGKLQAQISALVRVASPNDITANRLVTPGWMGMGTVSGLALPGGNANQAIPSGRYFVQATWTGSPFAAGDNRNRGYVDVGGWGQDGYQLQEFTPLFYVVGNPKMFRTNVNNTWGAWNPQSPPQEFGIGVTAQSYLPNLITVANTRAFAYGIGQTTNLTNGMDYGQGLFLNGTTENDGTMLLMNHDSDRAFMKRKRVGAWNPTVEFTTSAVMNLDPAVFTGAVAYYSSNANGEFWKFANGLLICKGKITTPSVAANANYTATATYPFAFLAGSQPTPVGIGRASVSTDNYGVIGGDPSNTNAANGAIFIIRNGATAQTFEIWYTSIGRWK